MNETKAAVAHTPGPWEWAGTALNGSIHLRSVPVYEVDGGSSNETVIGTGVNGVSVLNEADKSLIAAAPDLLQALEGLSDIVHEGLEHDLPYAATGSCRGGCVRCWNEEQASRAIVKARGGTP